MEALPQAQAVAQVMKCSAYPPQGRLRLWAVRGNGWVWCSPSSDKSPSCRLIPAMPRQVIGKSHQNRESPARNLIVNPTRRNWSESKRTIHDETWHISVATCSLKLTQALRAHCSWKIIFKYRLCLWPKDLTGVVTSKKRSMPSDNLHLQI